MNKSNSDLFSDFLKKDENSQKQTAMNMLSGLNSEQSRQVKEILNNKSKMQEILSSPQAQNLIKKFQGK